MNLPTTWDKVAPKLFRDGTHRVCSPTRTLERVIPHLAEIGITRIANLTGLDRIGLPVVMACRPNSRSLATSQGKGLTVDAARVSAVMEAIELYHAEHIVKPLLLASAQEMRRTSLLTAVENLAATRRSLYGDTKRILWIEGYEIISGMSGWLPFEVVHMSAVLPLPTGSGCFQSTSNGLASGNHRLEALAHALYEVIERDAAAVWQARGHEFQSTTEIAIDTIDNDCCKIVLDLFDQGGISVRVWETTSDVAVPAFLCEIGGDDGDGIRRFTGMGCHGNSGIALLRALTEAAQSRLTYVSGARDDIFTEDYLKTTFDYDRPQLPANPRSMSNRALASEFDNFSTEIEWLIARLQAIGIESIYVVDLTKEHLDIPVVRVVVPMLEGPDDDPSYQPGERARQAAVGQP